AITVNQSGAYVFPVTFTVNNIGGAAAQASGQAPWNDVAYLSSDGTLDNADVVVGYVSRLTPLAAGGSYTVSFTAITATTTGPGNYTLFVKADGRGSGAWGGGQPTDNGFVAEPNESNNTQSLAITLPTKPDLTVSNASFGAITVKQNGAYMFPVTFTVNNL